MHRSFSYFRESVVRVAIGILVLAVIGFLLVSQTGLVTVFADHRHSEQPITSTNLALSTVNENESNASKPDILHETTTPVEEPTKTIVEQFENNLASQLKAQVEGLLKTFYDTVQQPRSVYFTPFMKV